MKIRKLGGYGSTARYALLTLIASQLPLMQSNLAIPN
jgi:hypothetical protein